MPFVICAFSLFANVVPCDRLGAFIMPADTNAACSVAAFERRFVNPAPVVRAVWSMTGQGVFEAFVNGRRVGDDFLKPGFTSVEKCRHVFAYDVTESIDRRRGAENRLSAFVAPTWWCDYVCTARPWRTYPWKLGKNVAFNARLSLALEDGTTRDILTDENWMAAYSGPVRFADLYHGEVYDARETVKDLRPAVVSREFAGELRPAAAKVVLRRDLTLRPREISVIKGARGAVGTNEFGTAVVVRRCRVGEPIRLEPEETLVLDFGQNSAAEPSFTVVGNAGTRLWIRHAEMLNDSNGELSRGNDGPAGMPYFSSLRAARAEVRYTLKDGRQSYMPRYSFFGYRYAAVTTTAPVEFEAFESIPVSSITREMEHGSIVTGDARVNKLISNARWGLLSNYLSIPTDCPQRDERLGWTADTQVFMNTALYCADVGGFLEKYLADMRDGQYEDGLYTCFVPNAYFVFAHAASCGWTDAGVMIPHRLWKWYGRTEVIDRNWESMDRYMRYLRSQEEPYRINHCDWLAYEHKNMKPGADNRSQDPKYVKVMNAYFHPWMAQLMAEMANASGRTESAKAYAAEHDELVRRFRAEYVGEDGCIKDYWKGQCSDLYMLKLGLCADERAARATAADLVANIRAHGNRLQTGFLGTAILMPTLTFEANAPSVAYDLLLQDKNPSWLYSVDQGATTIWERWNSYTKERGFGPKSMNSFNHYAYGCVLEWLYAAAAGIRQSPGTVGWERPLLAPVVDRRLGFVDARFRSPRGEFRSKWSFDADGGVRWYFEIPEGVAATVVAPGADPKEYGAGRYSICIDAKTMSVR